LLSALQPLWQGYEGFTVSSLGSGMKYFSLKLAWQ
jgi:hypothetical protein